MKQYINMLRETNKDMFSFMSGAIEEQWTTNQLQMLQIILCNQ